MTLFSNKITKHSLYKFLIVGMFLIFLSACDLKSSLPVAFDKGSISIRLVDNVTKADVLTLQEGGAATATAEVKDAQGQAISEVPVVFESSIGGFSPATALTNSEGVALVTYDTSAGGGFGGPALGVGSISAVAQLSDRTLTSETLVFEILANSGIENTLPVNNSFAFFLPALKSNFTNNAANPEVLLPSVLDQTVTLQVNMGTPANSSVPDGTKVFFRTEFGAMDTDCSSSAGKCTTDWTATLPIATDGRSSILAHVEGVESYVDVNSNGSFDDGDTFQDSPGEAFLDQNENGSYDTGEWFKDKNANGLRDGADGLFSGPNCAHSTLCAATERVDIFGNVFVNMSNADAQILNLTRTDTGAVISRITEGVAVSFDLADSNGNPLPIGTQVSMSTTNGVLDFGFASTTIPAADVATNYSLTLGGDAVAGPGVLTIQTTALISGRQTILNIPVDD